MVPWGVVTHGKLSYGTVRCGEYVARRGKAFEENLARHGSLRHGLAGSVRVRQGIIEKFKY